MLPRLKFAGTVVDANIGQPIERFAVVPIIHFWEDFPNVSRDEAVQCKGGTFSLDLDRGDVEHSLQLEAPGYATVRTGVYAIGAKVPPLEIRMQPAPRFVGLVLDESEQPVANARVYVGSYSEHLYLHDLQTDNGGRSSNYHVTTNERGEFEIAHQLERYALTVISDAGYGEADRPSGELPGVLKVRPWAKLRGKLVQAGKPVPNVQARFAPIRDRGGDGWSDAWTNTQEGGAYLQTLDHYFVKPEPDGRIRVSGVEPGEYDLALHLYGSTEGCLVHPVGVTVVRVTVPEGQSALDLGTIKVPALAGLKAGDAAPALDFTGLDGKRQNLADARGKYVLIDFWATWCGPCVTRIPDVENLRLKFADKLDLLVVGANLDQDLGRAKAFLSERKLPWEHALLGDWSSTDVPKRFAVSSVPTYVLIGPDGRVLAHEFSLTAIAAILDKAAAR